MRLTITRTGGIAGLARQWIMDIAQPYCDQGKAALRRAQHNEHSCPDERIYGIRALPSRAG